MATPWTPQVLPVAARTGAHFASQLGFLATATRLREDLASKLPSVSFAPEVVAFLQSVTLILAPWRWEKAVEIYDISRFRI